MPWCRQCAKEYEKGTKRCPACSTKLQRTADAMRAPEEDEPAYLTTTSDNATLGMMEEVLAQADIPTLSKPHDLGEALMAYTGSIQMGADIYVPRSQLDRAKDIIRNLEEPLPEGTAEDIEDD